MSGPMPAGSPSVSASGGRPRVSHAGYSEALASLYSMKALRRFRAYSALHRFEFLVHEHRLDLLAARFRRSDSFAAEADQLDAVSVRAGPNEAARPRLVERRLELACGSLRRPPG